MADASPTTAAAPASANLAPVGSTVAAPQGTDTVGAYSSPYTSSTVVSDANVRENVIPSLQTKGTNLQTVAPPSKTSQTNPTPTPTTPSPTDDPTTDPNASYEDIYNKTFAGLDQVPVDSSTQSELDTIKSSMNGVDGDTNSMLDSITSNYNALQKTLTDSQNSQSLKIQNALNLAGSSRYAPISSSGILSAKNSYDVSQLNDLQTKENTAKQAAISAGQSKDFQLMQEQLKIYDGIRSQKQDLATKIATDISTRNQTLQKQNLQSEMDMNVSDLLQKGITDPSDILTELNSNGGNFTAADVAATVKSLSPDDTLSGLTGETKNFYTLQQRGMLPDSITSLPPGQQLFAYLKAEKNAVTITKSASTKPGKTAAPSDIQQGMSILNKNKGTDGFVDPYVYKQMYTTWVNAGYSPQSFTTAFPPKDYVNPAETILPPYLAPPKAKSSDTGSGQKP